MTDQSKREKTKKDTWLLKGHLVTDRYRLKRPLGSGGWGQVYLAKDQELGRQVAIKRLLPHLAADPEAVSRFHREASVVASIQNPNVLTIFDIIQEGNEHFIVMEYADAGTLSQVLTVQQILAPFEALSVGIDICKGLQAVHNKGIIHRDLKPANIMFFSRDNTFPLSKLGDFGIAIWSESQQRLTANDKILGTLIYLAPEQASRFSEATPLSDIYSLGVIIYEMLTGVLDEPFFLKRIGEGSKKHGMEYFAMLPDPLQIPLFRALQHNPKARLQSTDEMLQALNLARGRLTASLATQQLLEQTVMEMTLANQPTTTPSEISPSPSLGASEESSRTKVYTKSAIPSWLLLTLVVALFFLAASILIGVFSLNDLVSRPSTSASFQQPVATPYVIIVESTLPPTLPVSKPKPSALTGNRPSVAMAATPSPTPTPTPSPRPSATPTFTPTLTRVSKPEQNSLSGPVSLGLTLHDTGIRGDKIIKVSPGTQNTTVEYQEEQIIWGEVQTTIGSRTFQVNRQDLNDPAAILPDPFSLKIDVSPALLNALEKQSPQEPGIYPRRGDFWIGQIRCGSATPVDAVKEHTFTIHLLKNGQTQAKKNITVKIISNQACSIKGKTPGSVGIE